MTAPLVSDSEIAALREIALSGMQTDVAIYTHSNTRTDDGQKTIWTYTETVKGWLYTTLTPTITLISGVMATVGSLRLFLPVGTAIGPDDHVVINSLTYVVSDTAPDDTWQPLLKCSLRLAE